MPAKTVSSLKFNSRRVPGAVVVTDTENPSLYVFIAKISSGPEKGKHKAMCLDMVRSIPGNAELFATMNALPCELYPALKQKVIDAIAQSKTVKAEVPA